VEGELVDRRNLEVAEEDLGEPVVIVLPVVDKDLLVHPPEFPGG